MKVFIVGATGFIGRNITAGLLSDGHEVTALTRDAVRGRRTLGDAPEVIEGDPNQPGDWQKRLDGHDAVINLVGEPVLAKRWTVSQKQVLRDSRIDPTRLIVAGIEKAAVRPRVFLSGSAVSVYGNRGDSEVTEAEAPANDFSAKMCRDWEEAALKAQDLGTRVVTLRTSFVLGRGGAMDRMIGPFKMWLGGPIGGGRQYIPWIHVDDYVALGKFLLAADSVNGPINMAVGAVTNREFSAALGRALGRPSWLPVPAFVLKLALGKSSVIVLEGQRIVSAKATEAGYSFGFTEIDEALTSVLSSSA